MKRNENKIRALRAIAEGNSISNAAKVIGISSSGIRRNISTICRELKIPNDLGHIRNNRDDVLEKIRCLEETPAYKLPKRLQRALLEKTGFKSLHQLTPEIMAKASAERLLDSGFGVASVLEIQRWLEPYGLSLRLQKPQSESGRRDAGHAIELLKLYGFDVSNLVL